MNLLSSPVGPVALFPVSAGFALRLACHAPASDSVNRVRVDGANED